MILRAQMTYALIQVLHGVEGKSKEDIIPFLEKLTRKGKKLRRFSGYLDV
jgi:hypothetical protein